MAKRATVKNQKTAAKAHAQKSKERKLEIQELKALYIQEQNNPVVQDILKKIRSFADYHMKMAKDGVGAKAVGSDAKGQPILETVYYTNEKRLGEVDRAAGQEEIESYILRMFEIKPMEPAKKPTS